MSDKTGIEWTGATWNPVLGCTAVSPGCDNCYAAREASGRLRGHALYAGLAEGGTFTGKVRLVPERLDQPLRWRRPRRIFVNSMSDLFHDGVPDEFIARVFAVMAEAGQHTFQLLTKRHGRMRSLLTDPDWTFQGLVGAARYDLGNRSPMPEPGQSEDPSFGWPLPNVWLGVSVESQQWADIRIPALLRTPAAVRWISAEPLLGPVNLRHVLPGTCPCHGVTRSGLDWVVVGGESGPGARPMHPDWARKLRDQCTAAGVPFLFKQWGEHGEVPKLRADGLYDMTMPGITVADDGTVYHPGELSYPDGSRYGEAIRAGHDRAHLTTMYRTGKKIAGRKLDGRTWDEYPLTPGCGTAGCVGDCPACAAVLQAELAAHGLPQMTTGEPL